MDVYPDIELADRTLPGAWIGEGAYSSTYRGAYLCWLVIAGLISLGIYVGLSGVGWALSTKAATFFGLFLCAAHFLYIARLKPVNYLSPDLLFLIAYVMFHFGYLTFWALGIMPEFREVFWFPALYPKTMFIVNLGIVGFLFGYELAAPKRRSYDSNTIKLPTAGWMLVGLSLMMLAVSIFLVAITQVGLEALTAVGGRAFRGIRGFQRLWTLKSQIFALGFGIYIISVALRHGRLFKGKLGITILAIYFFALVMQGGRTSLVIVGMVLLLVRHYLIKPVKLRWLIAIMIGSIFLFGVMRIARGVTAFSVTKMVEEVRYAKKTGQTHWYDTFVETGSSVRTINMTIAIVPSDHSYLYGRSYVSSTIHIIPYLQGVVARVSPFWAVNAGDLIQYTFAGPEAAGLGFAIAGEGYINFGLVGAFFHMVFIGWFLRRIYVWFVFSLSPGRALVFFVSLGIFMVAVRNTTNTLFAPLAQVLVLAWLLKVFFGETELSVSDHQQGIQEGITDEYLVGELV